MDGEASTRHHGVVGYVNENLPGGRGISIEPWNLHKMLAGFSYGYHSSADRGFPADNFPSLQPSFSCFADRFVNHIPSNSISWIQHLRGSLPTKSYGDSDSCDLKDPVQQCSQHITRDGGSMVLDSSRCELVNVSNMTRMDCLEAKALSASKSHSEAERRRRKKINEHLNTLRSLLPGSMKSDKASLLAEVIKRVRILKRQVSEVYEYGSTPTEQDNLSVERDSTSQDGMILMKASFCCNDRPGLLFDLRHALDKLKLRTLKAEISTLGGRIKNVLILTSDVDKLEGDEDISVSCVQEALSLVMEQSAGGELSTGGCSKRHRVTSYDPHA